MPKNGSKAAQVVALNALKHRIRALNTSPNSGVVVSYSNTTDRRTRAPHNQPSLYWFGVLWLLPT